MNPFLHDTVGRPSATAPLGTVQQPMPTVGTPVGSGAFTPRAGRSAVRRLSHLLAAAGVATLAWTGTAAAVDLNSATLDQLQGIRGIGPKTAQIILDERARGGRYLSFADLSDRVRGIGPRRALALQSAGLTIDGGGTRLSGQGAAARQAAGSAKTSAISRKTLTHEEKRGE